MQLKSERGHQLAPRISIAVLRDQLSRHCAKYAYKHALVEGSKWLVGAGHIARVLCNKNKISSKKIIQSVN